jgi:putative transposase
VRRQCELLTVNHGQLYCAPKEERTENLEMMRLMDKNLINHPTEVVLSMVAFLGNNNFHVNPQRILRLFGLMGYQDIYPRKNLSKLGMLHFIKPYLLRGLKITRPNQVWCTVIT